MPNGKAFLGGIPYQLDIKKLESELPASVLTEGQVISHDTFESILGIKRGDGRYYGVINSWARHHRDSNGIHLHWVKSDGMKVLNPAELMDVGDQKTGRGIRQTIRGLKTYAWVDGNRLDETGKKRLDHKRINAAKETAHLLDFRREIAVELAPIKCLPRPQRKIS